MFGGSEMERHASRKADRPCTVTMPRRQVQMLLSEADYKATVSNNWTEWKEIVATLKAALSEPSESVDGGG